MDLAHVTQVNSTNLAQLLELRQLAIERGSKLRFAAPTDQVWAIMLTTGLDKVLDFAQDVPTALAALQMTR
jgi:anti-anti-sigma regulatory factor